MRIRPLGTNVLIRQLEADTVSPGGIHIPDTAQKKTNKGVVLAVGPGKTLPSGAKVPNECQVEDVVYWDKYQGTEFTLEGEKLWLVREDVISGRIPAIAPVAEAA